MDFHPCLTAGESRQIVPEPVLTIDKLALVFNVPSTRENDLKSLSFYKILHSILDNCEKTYNETKIFEYNVKYKDCLVSWGRGIESDSKLRIEFNPSKLKLNEICVLLQLIGKQRLIACNVSRIDVAIDYGRELNPLCFQDKHIRKHSVYWGKDTGAQSVYLGSPKSDKFTRIYNKALEQKESFDITIGGSWWRIEAEIKKGFFWLSTWNYDPDSNPFRHMAYTEKFYFAKKNTFTKLAEYFIEREGIQAFFAICDKKTRYRLQKKIIEVRDFKQPKDVFQEEFAGKWQTFKFEMESIAGTKSQWASR